MTTPEVNATVHTLGLSALSTLTLLQPPISEELEKKILESTIKLYFEPPSDKGKTKTPEQAEQAKQGQEQINANFNELLHSILFMDTTTVRLVRLINILSAKVCRIPPYFFVCLECVSADRILAERTIHSTLQARIVLCAARASRPS